jgi:hypothetical protein
LKIVFLIFETVVLSLILQIIIDMTQIDPSSRLSISEYLDILLGKVSSSSICEDHVNCDVPPPVPSPPDESSSCPILPPRSESGAVDSPANSSIFPAFFETSIYPLFLKMHWNGFTPDDRINIICQVSVLWLCPFLI